MLVGDTKGDQVMDAKYKRCASGGNELNNDKLIARARYLAPSPGSCHDVCKLGHKNEFDIKTKADPSVAKVMLRTQSERKFVPEVASSFENSKKTAFKRLSLPGIGVEKQARLPTKEIKKPEKWNEIKKPRNPQKKPTVSSNQKVKEIHGAVKDEEKKPVLPSSASCKAKPPAKRLITTNAKESAEPKAKEKKAEQRQREEKGSSTWKKKFKKAAATVLSSGNSSPKKPTVRRPESKSEDQNGEVEDEKSVLREVEVEREESENGSPEKLIFTRPESESEDQKGEVDNEKRALKEVEVEREETKNGSPKKLMFTRPESESEDQNGEVEDEKIVLKKVEIEREENENGSETNEVVILRHHETMEKKQDNIVKETAPEPILRRKDMVKALVGAFEALISLGDRRSLVAASAS